MKEASSKPQSDETGSIEDEIAAVLNKEKAKGGGAKRSTQEAALGGKKTTGAKLSQGEMDALRGQLSSCWNLPAGMEDGGGPARFDPLQCRHLRQGRGRAAGRNVERQHSFSMRAPCARYANAMRRA